MKMGDVVRIKSDVKNLAFENQVARISRVWEKEPKFHIVPISGNKDSIKVDFFAFESQITAVSEVN